MERRTFLGLAAGGTVGVVGGTVALAGCSEAYLRLRGVDSPARLSLTSSESLQVTMQVEHDGERVFDSTVETDDNRVETVAGDEYGEETFEETGEYTITVETADQHEQQTLELTWRELIDCNSNEFNIRIRDDSIDIGHVRTDADCGPL